MTARLILPYSNSTLRNKSEEVKLEEWESSLTKWTQDIRDTMFASGGMSLAATQVGISKKIFAIDLTQVENLESFGENFNDKILFFVNPALKIFGEEFSLFQESCLSFQGESFKIKRPTRAIISYFDLDQNYRQLTLSGKDAALICHEIDHLDGKLLIDKLNVFDKKCFLKKFSKPKREISEGYLKQIREQRKAKIRNSRK